MQEQKINRREILKTLVTLSIPTILEEILSTLLQYVDTAMVGHLGEKATASVSVTTTVTWLVNSIPAALGVAVLSMTAKALGSGDREYLQKIAKQILILVFACGLFAGGISTLIGISLGEEDEKQMEAVASVSVKLTMILMCVSGVILFFVARPLMGLLTESSRVVEIGAGMLRIVAFSEPFYGLMIVTEGIFYGLGKTKYAFYVETFCMWGIRILFTFFCVKIWHFGLETVWYCMIADNVCKAVLFSVPLVVKRKRSCLTKLG